MDGSQIFILTDEGTVIFHENKEFVRTRENLLTQIMHFSVT